MIFHRMAMRKIFHRAAMRRAFVVCSLWMAGAIVYCDYREATSLRFVVDMETSVSGRSQVFYRVRRGYREKDSHSILIPHGGVQERYIFPLAAKRIESIRFDPMDRPAEVRINAAWMENDRGDVVKRFPLADFRPVQQIDKMDAGDGTLVLRTAHDASDPILEIGNSAIENQAGWTDYIRKRGWILGCGLLGLLLFMGMGLWVISFGRKQHISGMLGGMKRIVHVCWEPFWAFAAFGAVLFGIKLWLIGDYGNATPYWDQWDAEAALLYKPFLEGTLDWAALFSPHNEHRIFTTRLLALMLLHVNGIWNPLLQMVVNAGLHIAGLTLCIALLAHVVGRRHLLALLSFSLAFFAVPFHWENTLAGFQAQFYFAILFSILGLWLTVVPKPLSLRWWVGVICAVLAFLSMASGILALAAAAAIGLVLHAMGLRKNRRQLLAVGILAGLFAIGAVLTPSVARHASSRASSFSQFFDAWTAVLGWPISPHFLSALACHLPALVFAGGMLWKRPPEDDRRWFLLALVAWTLGQAACLAYGRAGGLISRYLDLFAIGILANFACLISIAQDHVAKRRGWTVAAVGVWTIAVLLSLGLFAGKRVPADLAARRDTALAQEINTLNYLATADFGHLKDKARFHVPYPDPKRLARILESPEVRAILPTNVRVPLAPVSVESQPADAFLPCASGGVPATVPERRGMAWGSHGVRGDAATGEISMRFHADRSALLAIPVAGYPRRCGMKIEVEQNGRRSPVFLESNPAESWAMAHAKVGKGAFSIRLADSSPVSWAAIGAPVETGRLDALVDDLLGNYLAFVMLGLVAGVLSITWNGMTNHSSNFREDY